MEFKEKDFEGMIFRVDKLRSTQDPLKVYPQLNIYPEFRDWIGDSNFLSFSKVFKYIGLLYQENSPLLTIDNITKRRYHAALLAKFVIKKNGEFDKHYQSVIDNKHDPTRKMIMRLCRMQRNTDFTEWSVYNDVFHKELQELHSIQDDPKSRKLILDNINKYKSNIDKAKKNLLFDDVNNKLLVADFLDEIENTQLGLSPEQIAIKLRDKKDPLDGWSPYDEEEEDE